MTKISVNINKIATIRNARGGDTPNLVSAAINCQKFGADGITIHPRPDERHAKFSDLSPLKKLVSKYENKEFNIEGYPSENFIQKVINVNKLHQSMKLKDGQRKYFSVVQKGFQDNRKATPLLNQKKQLKRHQIQFYK